MSLTWEHLPNSPDQALSCIFIGNSLYVGTQDSGAFVSTDHFSSWSAINTGFSATPRSVHDLFVTPLGKLLAGTRISGVNNDYRFDGSTWTSSTNTPFSLRPGAVIDSLGRILFSEEHGLRRSTNDGVSFGASIGQVNPSNPAVYCLGGPYAGKIYAGTESSGVYYSTNDGTSWTAIGGLGSPSPQGNINSIHVNALGQVVVTCGQGAVYVNTTGSTWVQGAGYPSTYLSQDNTAQDLILLDNGDMLLHGGRVYRSTDNGATWTLDDAGIPAGRINTTAPEGDPQGTQSLFSHTLSLGPDGRLYMAIPAAGYGVYRTQQVIGDAAYVTIQTIGTIPPAGTIINQSYAAQMPALVSPNSFPVFTGDASANHYKLIGLNITNVGGSTVTQELVTLGGSRVDGTQPHHIDFSRCWVHEATNDTTTPNSTITTAIRGFDLNAADINITDCRIAGFRTYQPVSQGVEASNGILLASNNLRVNLSHNYIEAWFAPIFLGGSAGESPNTATLSAISFNTGSHTGAATFSSISNLAIGDLVAFQTAGGHTPPTNNAHPNELVVYQIGKVTNIAGNVVSFQSWGAYDGDLAGGNPLLQAPCGCGSQSLPGGVTSSPIQAQWNGYLNESITVARNQIVLAFNPTEAVWVATGGSPTTQPRSTQTNTGNAPKGFIEIKMALNMLVDGNVFSGWQNGFVLTARNQGNAGSSGGFPWAGLFNVTISNNWWTHMVNWDRIFGFPFGGPQLEDNEYTSVRSGPVTFTNNLIDSGVETFCGLGAATGVIATHNTYVGDEVPPGTSMFLGQGANSPSFTFENNITPNNEYGRNCQISPNTVATCWPGLVFTNNLVLDNRSASAKSSDGPLNYPGNVVVQTQSAIQWVNQSTSNFRLQPTSPGYHTATDGQDMGVVWSTLVAALGFDPSGLPLSNVTVSGGVTFRTGVTIS